MARVWVTLGFGIAAALSGGCHYLTGWRYDPNYRAPQPEATPPAPAAPTPAPNNLYDKSVRPLFDNTAPKPPAGPPGYAPPSGQPYPDATGGVMPAGYRPEYQAPGGGVPPVRMPDGTPYPRPGESWGPPPDPHLRGAPTASGTYLNLGPGETALDRATELVRRVDAVTAENKALTFRVKTLEAAAVEREQALSESLREVESASADVARARTDIQAMRSEVAKLRDRVRRVEEDEVEMMQKLIEALNKALFPGGAGKSDGKK